jgi:hypothetical protein
MLTVVDERLRREVAELRLRYTCESCAYFETHRGQCSNGFPNEAHRTQDLDRAVSVTFCKQFELA